MKRIVLVVAVTLPLVACGKEQPKKVEVRPVRPTPLSPFKAELNATPVKPEQIVRAVSSKWMR